MRYYEVEVKGEPRYSSREFAPTAGRAKYQYLLRLWDAWGSEAVSFQHLVCRSLGGAEKAPINAKYFVEGRRHLRSEVVASIREYLAGGWSFTRENWEYSYPKWAEDTAGWQIAGLGGTDIMLALMWYHHIHRPSSVENRAAVILGAIIVQTERLVEA